MIGIIPISSSRIWILDTALVMFPGGRKLSLLQTPQRSLLARKGAIYSTGEGDPTNNIVEHSCVDNTSKAICNTDGHSSFGHCDKKIGGGQSLKGSLKKPSQNNEKRAKHEKNSRKGVHFKKTAKVVLIPMRDEYVRAGLKGDLWWEGSDYIRFRRSTASELTSLMCTENISGREAMMKLYQPLPARMDLSRSLADADKNLFVQRDDELLGSVVEPQQNSQHRGKVETAVGVQKDADRAADMKMDTDEYSEWHYLSLAGSNHSTRSAIEHDQLYKNAHSIILESSLGDNGVASKLKGVNMIYHHSLLKRRIIFNGFATGSSGRNKNTDCSRC